MTILQAKSFVNKLSFFIGNFENNEIHHINSHKQKMIC